MNRLNEEFQARNAARSLPDDFQEPQCARIPAGDFLMGCETGRDDEKPVHRVWVDEFELGIFQVRNQDYSNFLDSTGRPPPAEWTHDYFNQAAQPVVGVSWNEAAKYCQWISEVTGRHYRLPTEAEWERAARGGREQLAYTWGNEAPEAWLPYLRRWKGEVRGPLPVGLDAPNPFGIFDIGENIHEWCSDWFDRNYYATSPQHNPFGPEQGERRASRGGSWRHHVKVSRCAARSSIPPAFQYADYGFRVASDPAPEV